MSEWELQRTFAAYIKVTQQSLGGNGLLLVSPWCHYVYPVSIFLCLWVQPGVLIYLNNVGSCQNQKCNLLMVP